MTNTATDAAAVVPVYFDVASMGGWFVAEPERLTMDNMQVALSRVGMDKAPHLLAHIHQARMLTSTLAAVTVGGAWSDCDYPDRALDRDVWREMFGLAGYTQDGTAAERPTRTLTLYRGTVAERRADWSWTDRLDVARRYAAGIRQRPTGLVWTAEVPAANLLCRNLAREEFEYVVDTEGLRITRFE
ncbi:hypothetical protein B5P43_15580 [Bacillus sp. SRB_336]|nr:hypothetical protein B5P43_15580 [Bacillus sp. SRB_336]